MKGHEAICDGFQARDAVKPSLGETPGIAVATIGDHRRSSESLRDQLRATPGFRCVLTALSLRNVVERVERANPDVVILDLHFPDGSGMAALADIKRRRPQQRVLILSAIDTRDEILMAYCLGASGYVLKGDGAGRILAAIELVADGSSIFSPRIARELRQLTLGTEDIGWVLKLTEAELNVLELLVQGMTAAEVAERRGSSVSTVQKQCEAIRRKAQIDNMRHAIAEVAPWVRILQKFWNLRHGNGLGFTRATVPGETHKKVR